MFEEKGRRVLTHLVDHLVRIPRGLEALLGTKEALLNQFRVGQLHAGGALLLGGLAAVFGITGDV